MNDIATFQLISFVIMFILIVCFMIVIIVRQKIHNKNAPRIVTVATIRDKKIFEYYTRERSGSGEIMHKKVHHLYYIIFSLEGGDSIKLQVSKEQYNKLKKNVTGKLTFQGTQYIGFEYV